MKHALLLLAALTAALCLSRTSAQTPPSPPLTGKIAHITILGAKNIPIDTVRAVLTLHPGDTYTPDATAKDVAAIKGMGDFYAITNAETTDPAGGVNVAYTVAENPVVTGIKFTADTPNGQPSVPAAQLIAQMKTPIGKVLNTTVLVTDLNTLFNRGTGYFVNQGYLTDVSTDINIDKAGIITIPLKEYRIQSIKITGNKLIKTADILAQMHAKVGDIYDNAALNADLILIYETGGFRQVEDWKWEVVGPEKINVTIPIAEQPAAMGILDEKQGIVIPFLYDPLTNPFPVVQVSVNGKPPLPFVVDTGSNSSLSLDFWAAKALGLSTDSPREKNDDGVSYQEVPVQSVAFGPVSQKNNSVFKLKKAVVLDLGLLSEVSPKQHIAGIIGLEMLAPVTSRFDFAAKTLTIFSEPHAPLHIPRGTVLPLRGTTGGNFLVRATLAPNTYADLVLDTGSNSTLIPLSALNVLHPTATAYGGFYERIDATYVCPTLRLPKLEIGSLSVPDVVVGTLPPSTRLSLGMDILAGYRMTLDGPNGQLILEPSAHSGRYVNGWSGLDITQDDHGWRATAFRDNSPARLAGLQVGDRVVSVNGIGLDELTKFQAQDLLAGIAGRPMQVAVKQGPGQGRNVFVSWLPLDIFSAPIFPIYGLALKKAPGGPWVIQNILHGCPGDLAGLQVGDTITQVQGEEVAKMTITHNEDLVEQPAVTLEIERTGVAKPFTVRLSVQK